MTFEARELLRKGQASSAKVTYWTKQRQLQELEFKLHELTKPINARSSEYFKLSTELYSLVRKMKIASKRAEVVQRLIIEEGSLNYSRLRSYSLEIKHLVKSGVITGIRFKNGIILRFKEDKIIIKTPLEKSRILGKAKWPAALLKFSKNHNLNLPKLKEANDSQLYVIEQSPENFFAHFYSNAHYPMDLVDSGGFGAPARYVNPKHVDGFEVQFILAETYEGYTNQTP